MPPIKSKSPKIVEMTFLPPNLFLGGAPTIGGRSKDGELSVAPGPGGITVSVSSLPGGGGGTSEVSGIGGGVGGWLGSCVGGADVAGTSSVVKTGLPPPGAGF